MPTPAESRAALQLLTGSAVSAATRILAGGGRAAVLDLVPALIGYYSDGTAALAADFYDDQRELAAAAGRYTAEPIVVDRMEKIGRGLGWATEPISAGQLDLIRHEVEQDVLSRLSGVVQTETARPYRDTITTNQRRDPTAVGWERVAAGDACGFCRMLADRGAVYRRNTANFASHSHCHCTARPVFEGQPAGPEASVMQYTASKRRRTDADRENLRKYLAQHYPDAA